MDQHEFEQQVRHEILGDIIRTMELSARVERLKSARDAALEAAHLIPDSAPRITKRLSGMNIQQLDFAILRAENELRDWMSACGVQS